MGCELKTNAAGRPPERGVHGASTSAADRPIEPIIPVRTSKRLESRAPERPFRPSENPAPHMRLGFPAAND